MQKDPYIALVSHKITATIHCLDLCTILSIDKIMLSVPGCKSTSTGLQHMLFSPLSRFPLICKSCNLSLELTEPTSKPAQQQRPRLQSVFHLSVRMASFLVVNKSCYFEMIIYKKNCVRTVVSLWTGRTESTSPHPEAFFLLASYQSVIYQALLQEEEPSDVIQPEVRVSAFQHTACFQH